MKSIEKRSANYANYDSFNPEMTHNHRSFYQKYVSDKNEQSSNDSVSRYRGARNYSLDTSINNIFSRGQSSASASLSSSAAASFVMNRNSRSSAIQNEEHSRNSRKTTELFSFRDILNRKANQRRSSSSSTSTPGIKKARSRAASRKASTSGTRTSTIKSDANRSSSKTLNEESNSLKIFSSTTRQIKIFTEKLEIMSLRMHQIGPYMFEIIGNLISYLISFFSISN